jgi:RNA polymerase sigma factor (sigma-70 family)
MRTKNKANVELDELVVGWKTNPNDENFNKIYSKLKWYLVKKTYDDETLSDANWILYKALKEFEPNRNVYFMHFFDVCFRRYRKERYLYNNNQARKSEHTVSLDAQVDFGEKKGTIADIIEDTKFTNHFNQQIRKWDFIDFVNKNVEEKHEREILIMYYNDPNLFQTDIAQQLGISQAMVHKRIKGMAHKSYADRLKKMLKGVDAYEG